MREDIRVFRIGVVGLSVGTATSGGRPTDARPEPWTDPSVWSSWRHLRTPLAAAPIGTVRPGPCRRNTQGQKLVRLSNNDAALRTKYAICA